MLSIFCQQQKNNKTFQFILKLGGLGCTKSFCTYFGIFFSGILKFKKKDKTALLWKRRKFTREKILLVDERTKRSI